ncbi:MAG TPA: serine--tRNA ligase, partial [Thermomicrobiales bacterium]|nr:serine--tRNA ligase [Thermomicrobiales bacterium]
MLDLRFIREHPDEVRGDLAKLYVEAPLDELLALDERHRALLGEVEELRAARNAGSKEVGKLRDAAERERRIAEMRALGDRVAERETELAVVKARLDAALLELPNLPDPDVPVGKDEAENVVTRYWAPDGAGAPPALRAPVRLDEWEATIQPAFERYWRERGGCAFEPKPHWNLGPALGLIDFERGVKVSGSRFYFLKGLGAKLQRAVIAWMVDLHVAQGYTEVYPPYLVRTEALVGTGQLPKFADNQYHDAPSDLWLIPTAEVPVTNMHRDEILEPGTLPLDYVAYSACFRREQFSAGRDTRGIKRGHQFDKVEMVKFAAPDASDAALAALVGDAAAVLEALAIPYRVVQMCTGDLSFTAAKKLDLEA